MGEITLVTCFFNIGRGEDKNTELRKTPQKYIEAFSRWARIQNKLIVYTDDAGAKDVMEVRSAFGLADKTEVIQIDNLFELEPELYARMQKAAANPHFIDFRYIPEAFSNNPKYDYLWMMKYYFMTDAYNKGLLSENVVWFDFGFDHGGKLYYDEEDFNFKWEYDFGNKIHIFCLHDPSKVLGIESLQYLDDCVTGCMYALSRELVPTFWQLVRNAMEALLMLDCVDDDQQLVLMAYKARPDLFEVHVTGWQMGIKECGGSHMKLREIKPPKGENKIKKMIRLTVRKFIPNKKDPKRLYAAKCYEKAKRIYGK
ncbi:MAG: hypothetical protein IKW08_01855 [Roseburia sp.]|nr:hypothetical protein [Roseburia sp.]